MSETEIKIKWVSRYVDSGTIPDLHNRWALDCYVFVDITKAIENYKWVYERTGEKLMAVRFCTILQKGTVNGEVPSLVHKFCVSMPSFDDAGNTGFAHNHNYFSNDLEDLKNTVEINIKKIVSAFKNIG